MILGNFIIQIYVNLLVKKELAYHGKKKYIYFGTFCKQNIGLSWSVPLIGTQIYLRLS